MPESEPDDAKPPASSPAPIPKPRDVTGSPDLHRRIEELARSASLKEQAHILQMIESLLASRSTAETSEPDDQ